MSAEGFEQRTVASVTSHSRAGVAEGEAEAWAGDVCGVRRTEASETTRCSIVSGFEAERCCWRAASTPDFGEPLGLPSAHLFDTLDGPSPAPPARPGECVWAAVGRHVRGRGREGGVFHFDVDEDLLFVEAFSRIEADDDEPAELLDVEAVVQEVTGVEVVELARVGVVVGAVSTDGDADGLGSEECAGALERELYVRGVAVEEDDGGDAVGEHLERELCAWLVLGGEVAVYAALYGLGDGAVVQAVGEEGVAVGLGVDFSLDGERDGERLLLLHALPQVALKQGRAQLQPRHADHVAHTLRVV